MAAGFVVDDGHGARLDFPVREDNGPVGERHKCTEMACERGEL